MIEGNQREEEVKTSVKKYVGFTSVEIRAINPTRQELNKLLGKEDSENDREIVYASQDQEGNDRVRLTFWLLDRKLDKYFVHSFNLTDKVRVSKDGVKTQYVNSTCNTTWADSEDNIVDFFKNFQDKEKNNVAPKKYHPALMGEEELVDTLRTWLGRMVWNDPQCSVVVDTKALLKEDYKELRSLIDGNYDSPLTILTGVSTDENDSTKQYQKVYDKFLPANFMGYINKGFKFPSDYSRKAYTKFETEVEGDYGFKAHFELCPIKEYDRDNDVSAATQTADVTPSNSKY